MNALLATLLDKARTIFLGLALTVNSVVRISIGELLQQTLILGLPGSGKSKLAQHIVKTLWDQFIPVIAIDGEGDLSEDIFADVIAHVRDTGSEEILKRTHYLRVDWKKAFLIDPFDNSHVPNDPTAYKACLDRDATDFSNAMIRSLGETSMDQMPRLQRTLKSILIAIGTPLPDGRRLPLANIFILLNFDHKKFTEVYTLIAPQLPDYVQADFTRLLAIHAKRPQDVLMQTESTINRLRALLTPCVQMMFSEVERQTFQLLPLIRQRGIIIFNIRDSQYFAPEQADALGRVIVYMVLSALRSIEDRGERILTFTNP